MIKNITLRYKGFATNQGQRLLISNHLFNEGRQAGDILLRGMKKNRERSNFIQLGGLGLPVFIPKSVFMAIGFKTDP